MSKGDLAVGLVLSALSVALLALLGTGALPAWSQSPSSPLLVENTPPVQVPIYPAVGVSPVSPGGSPALDLPARLLEAELWRSPWSWVVVGIVLFGGLAWLLTALFRRLEPQA